MKKDNTRLNLSAVACVFFVALFIFAINFVRLPTPEGVVFGGQTLAENIDWLIRKIKDAKKNIENIKFDFTQRIKIEGIGDETVTGKAIFERPDKLFIEYKTPDKQVIISNGEKCFFWFPDEKQVLIQSKEEIDDTMGLGKAILYFFYNFDSLVKDCDIKMVEKKKRKYLIEIENMKILISNKNFLPVEIKEKNELASVLFKAKGVKTNQKLKKDIFKFKIPKGTTVFDLSTKL